jgi:phage shock protein PspC (stress-responsive transcriptional regulator)
MLENCVTIGIYILSILLIVFVIRVLKILKSQEGRKIAGVCAGLSRASDMPAWMVRVFFLILIPFAGYGIVLYLSLWLFMLKKKSVTDASER